MRAYSNVLFIGQPCCYFLLSIAEQSEMDVKRESSLDYCGDSLSPEDPRKMPLIPVMDGGKEVFFCHLCSFCGECNS